MRPDGSTITINSTTGVITASAATPYTLPIATTAVIGGVRPDANTIVINSSTGIISSIQTQGDWTNTDTSSRAYIQNNVLLNDLEGAYWMGTEIGQLGGY